MAVVPAVSVVPVAFAVGPAAAVVGAVVVVGFVVAAVVATAGVADALFVQGVAVHDVPGGPRWTWWEVLYFAKVAL